jgi:hypothetical protein
MLLPWKIHTQHTWLYFYKFERPPFTISIPARNKFASIPECSWQRKKNRKRECSIKTTTNQSKRRTLNDQTQIKRTAQKLINSHFRWFKKQQRLHVPQARAKTSGTMIIHSNIHQIHVQDPKTSGKTNKWCNQNPNFAWSPVIVRPLPETNFPPS